MVWTCEKGEGCVLGDVREVREGGCRPAERPTVGKRGVIV